MLTGTKSRMIYKIRLERSVLKDIKRLSKADKGRIKQSVDQLAENPRKGDPLKGQFKGLWRLRVGSYRIIYSIKDDQLTILILRIGHRKNVYEAS